MAGAASQFNALANAPDMPLDLDPSVANGQTTAAPLPPPGNFTPTVPPPSSPQQDAAAAASAAKAKAQAAAAAAANSDQPVAAPTAAAMFTHLANAPDKQLDLEGATAPEQGTGRMLVNSALNAPFSLLAPFGDVLNQGINMATGSVNELTGSKIPALNTDLEPPFKVAPTSEGGRMASQAVSALAQYGLMSPALKVLGPMIGGMVGKGVSQMGELSPSAAPSVAAGGALGQFAADQAPPKYKELANLGGNVVGGSLESVAQSVLGDAASAALRGGGRFGIGPQGGAGAPTVLGNVASKLGFNPKITPGETGIPNTETPIRATASQAEAAVNRVRTDGGPNLAKAINSDPLQAARDDVAARLHAMDFPAPSPDNWDYPKQQIGETEQQYHDRYMDFFDQSIKRGSIGRQYGPPAEENSRTDLLHQLRDLDAAIAQRGNQWERTPGESPTLLQIAPGKPGEQNKLQNLDVEARNKVSNFGNAEFTAQQHAANEAQIASI